MHTPSRSVTSWLEDEVRRPPRLRSVIGRHHCNPEYIMKTQTKLLGAALALLFSAASISAVHVGATALIGNGQYYDTESLYQNSVPGGAGYEWHLYAYPAPDGYGSAELTFSGPGFSVYRYLTTGSYDSGGGSVASTGTVSGSVTVSSNGAAACESSINLYW